MYHSMKLKGFYSFDKQRTKFYLFVDINDKGNFK